MSLLAEFMARAGEQMAAEGRESSANAFLSCSRSVSRFLGGADVELASVDRQLIERYAAWLAAEGVAGSTQSFYLRTLRRAVYSAMEQGLTARQDGLFAGLNIKASERSKAQVNQQGAAMPASAMMARIAAAELGSKPRLELARDLFMFGFYCHGMELTDIINLTADNVAGSMLTFRRRGTGTVRSVALAPQALQIIEKYRTPGAHYLFPLKTASGDCLEKSLKNKVGLWLNALGKSLGIKALTFNMNIRAWQQLAAGINPAGLIGGH